jgi:hypothetical protein
VFCQNSHQSKVHEGKIKYTKILFFITVHKHYSIFCIFFVGLECVAHSFANAWIGTQRAAVASRRY